MEIINNKISAKEFEEAFKIAAKKHIKNETFEFTESNKFLLNNFYFWLTRQPFKNIDPETGKIQNAKEKDFDKGFYIAGGTGTGKTTIIKILSDVIKFFNIEYLAPGGRKIKLSPNCISSKMFVQDFIKNGYNSTLWLRCSLCIDDLGAEPETSQYMGNNTNVCDDIIFNRSEQDSDKITWITSNYPINYQPFINRYGDRFKSRIISMCNYYTLTGKDFRL